jgi:hypothetical protein
LGGAGRVIEAGDALDASGAFGGGDVFGVNQPADAGPQTRAKTGINKAAIRVTRANMKQAELR